MMSRSLYETPPAFVLELLRAAECVAASVQSEQLPRPKLPDDLQEPLSSPSNQPGTEQTNIENTSVTSWDSYQSSNGLVSFNNLSPNTAANTDSLHYSLITSLLASLSQTELNGALQSSIDSVTRHQTSLGNTPTASLPENSEAGIQLSDLAVQSNVDSKLNHHSGLQSIEKQKMESCCIMPVPVPVKLEDEVNDIKYSRQITLEGTRTTSPEPESTSSILASYENCESFPSSLLQEHPGQNVLTEGDHSSVQKSPLPCRFTLVPGPSPIMSPREMPPSMKYEGPVPQAVMDFLHSHNSIAVAARALPKQHMKLIGKKRAKYSSNGERYAKEVKVTAQSSDGKAKSYTKRARFARCTKKLKYLCSVCSKPDCMKCTHCINRSTGHQACLEKPKEQCLSYIKMLHELDSHSNSEDNSDEAEGINFVLNQQRSDHDNQ